jgi:hypothetical protein
MTARRPAKLPYEGATSGERALADMQRVLQAFGCQSFGSMMDFERGALIVQFRCAGRQVHVEASTAGYAAAWLQRHPWSGRARKTREAHEREAQRVASLAVYSILRDWVKGQVAAVETGILSFDAAFLGQIMLASGVTALEHVTRKTGLLTSGSKPDKT